MGIKMVVVSSVEILLKAIKKQLEKQLDLEVLSAWHVEEALELLNSQHIDLLLTDNKFKFGPGGLELVEQVRKKYPHIKIMIMSSLLEQKQIPPGIWFLQKPWGFDNKNELIEKVKEMIKEAH